MNKSKVIRDATVFGYGLKTKIDKAGNKVVIGFEKKIF